MARDLAGRFSAPAEKLFNLLATDIGRPLSAVRHNLVLPAAPAIPARQRPEQDAAPYPVEELVRQVIDTVREQECEARDKDGHWYSLRARPYLTADNKVDGAVLRSPPHTPFFIPSACPKSSITKLALSTTSAVHHCCGKCKSDT